MGAPAHSSRSTVPQHAAADAAARPEPRRLPALRRRHRASGSSTGGGRNGIDIFRVFDALNDIRNIETAARGDQGDAASTSRAPSSTPSARCTRSTTSSTYAHAARRHGRRLHLHQGHGRPALAVLRRADWSARLKDEIGLPIQLHCHYIGGMAPMTYLKAIEAGVDVVDTAIVPLAFGNSQPATEMIVAALTGVALRHRARPRAALRDRRVLREGAAGGRLRARRHLARSHARSTRTRCPAA